MAPKSPSDCAGLTSSQVLQLIALEGTGKENVPSNPGSGSQPEAASLSGVSDPVEKGKPTASVSPNQIERESRFERRIRRGIAQPRSHGDVPSVKRPCTEKRSGPKQLAVTVSPDREPRAPYELTRDARKAANALILKNLGIGDLVAAMR